jgi:hypothetical protein
VIRLRQKAAQLQPNWSPPDQPPCERLTLWPLRLPGTRTPSFKVSYNNSIHSIPLRNTIPPSLPPSDPFTSDLSLHFCLQQHFLFHPTTPPYSSVSPLCCISFFHHRDILFTSGRPRGGRASGQNGRTKTISCYCNKGRTKWWRLLGTRRGE